jgi:hypothetical protein
MDATVILGALSAQLRLYQRASERSATPEGQDRNAAVCIRLRHAMNAFNDELSTDDGGYY